ncbi:GNAT family N-acetyltransferase [Amorphus orientalis]|uniref:RimJ/RimL family protein N-acetyltransferase n=1 Tax=Amorphus orientalis TaxID=649198 RepID=A0AAE4ARY5_9HYPH|nr:GNAT family N-acetyltransferase [Amorphus orientalis]MDQ0314623.1 RimJ/RimL family protein N-acetyltransferase [Amorphus orientalis]
MEPCVDAWCEPLPLLTSRLSLMAVSRSDAAVLAALGNDFEIAKYTARLPYPLTEQAVANWLGSHGPTKTALKICRRSDGGILGVVGISQIAEGRGELGYWVGRQHWGQGIATEAAQAILDFGFEHRGFEWVEAACRVTNPASRRVIEKCGFQPCGNGLMHSVAVGGTVPIERYGLDRKTWGSLKRWARA